MQLIKWIKNIFSPSSMTTNVPNETAHDNKKYSSDDSNSTLDIEELNRISKERSEQLYNSHLNEYKKFDYKNIDPKYITDKPLTSIEKYFLKYIANREVDNPLIAAYWTYEYSINYKELLSKLIINGYLEISNSRYNISFLKVTELKEILRNAKLPISGRKQELIERINNNIPEEKLEEFIPSKASRFVLTDKGLMEIKNLPDSATKNLELEDECLKLIHEQKFNDAYKLICLNELNKKIPRGLGIDWNSELKKGLSQVNLLVYQEFMSTNIDNQLNSELIHFSKDIKACIILGVMLGLPSDKIIKTLKRITNIKVEKEILIRIIQSLQFNVMDKIQKKAFQNLKS